LRNFVLRKRFSKTVPWYIEIYLCNFWNLCICYYVCFWKYFSRGVKSYIM